MLPHTPHARAPCRRTCPAGGAGMGLVQHHDGAGAGRAVACVCGWHAGLLAAPVAIAGVSHGGSLQPPPCLPLPLPLPRCAALPGHQHRPHGGAAQDTPGPLQRHAPEPAQRGALPGPRPRQRDHVDAQHHHACGQDAVPPGPGHGISGRRWRPLHGHSGGGSAGQGGWGAGTMHASFTQTKACQRGGRGMRSSSACRCGCGMWHMHVLVAAHAEARTSIPRQDDIQSVRVCSGAHPGSLADAVH